MVLSCMIAGLVAVAAPGPDTALHAVVPLQNSAEPAVCYQGAQDEARLLLAELKVSMLQ